MGELPRLPVRPRQAPAAEASRGQAAPWVTHLEEPVVVDDAVLRVEEGEQRVLGV